MWLATNDGLHATQLAAGDSIRPVAGVGVGAAAAHHQQQAGQSEIMAINTWRVSSL